jgi:hypothetical protein
MKYSDYKAYQKAEWLGRQEHKVFTKPKVTLLDREIYQGKKPRTDWIPTLVAAVAIVTFCWGVYAVISTIEALAIN